MAVSNKLKGFNPKNGITFIKNLLTLYGKPFFFLNASIFFGNVGIIYYLVNIIQLPYYRAAGHDGLTLTEMSAIAKAPWSSKGFIGIVADLLPLFGRQKFYYLLGAVFIGMGCFLSLGLIPFSAVNRQPLIAGSVFFVLSLTSATCDLLVEAKYIELMQKNPNLKTDLLTFAWFCETCGQLIPSTFTGIIADNMDVRACFFFFFPFLILPAPAILFGGVIDDHVPKEKSNRVNMERFYSQWRLVVLTFFQATLAFSLLIITLLFGTAAQLIYIVCSGFTLIFLGFFFLEHISARYVLFIYLYYSLYVNVQGALDYFYTAEEECVPGGPQFTFFITSSLAPLIYTFAQFFAIFCFQIVFTDWKFRSVFLLTVSMKIIASLADVAIVQRWTRSIGLPDALVYLFGYSTVSMLASVINSLINSYMIAKLCPRNFEATMYAFISGCTHFSVATASYIGAFFMDVLKIRTIIEDGIPCDYSNLTLLVLIGHVFLPLLTIPLIYYGVPNIRLDEYVRDPNDDSLVYSIKKAKSITKPQKQKV